MRRRGLGPVLVGFGAAVALHLGHRTAAGRLLGITLIAGMGQRRRERRVGAR